MSRKRKQSNLIFLLSIISLFLLGVVTGMIVIHLYDRSRLKEEEGSAFSTENIAPKEEDPAEEIVRIYVPERKRVFGKIPVNSYIPENFTLEEGFLAYYNEEGEKISHLGIDLSYHNTGIDWELLSASPVEFIMLRCGYRGYSEGGLVEDEKFREYAQKCNEYGIPLGVYFFTQAITVEEAEKEADFVLNLIADYELSYPVAIDIEDVGEATARTKVNELSKELRTEMALAFCERIKEAGYYPMIYASENYFRRAMNVSEFSDYDLWAPLYLETDDFLYDHTIWQYTDKGNVPGIDTKVDLNICMVDYASFVPALRKAALDQAIIETVPETAGMTEILETEGMTENLETEESPDDEQD
ncbi:MAG: glycoside hydrolase family 25 protein [Lachnospiraceae bacterium]|nr:glycoside hydrolase family 25 protein [Lachnospiraceae bacterium]